MNQEPVTAVEEKNVPAGTPVKKKRKKGRVIRRILLILLALMVLFVLGGYTYWVIRGSSLDLPYGLKAGMNLESARAALEENGFQADYASRPDEIHYLPYEVFGVRSGDVLLKVRDETVQDGKYRDIRLSFNFSDETVKYDGKEEAGAYNGNHPSPEFERILSELRTRYGSPSENLIRGEPFYEWSGIRMNLDFYTVSLYYYRDGHYALNYSWTKGKLF